MEFEPAEVRDKWFEVNDLYSSAKDDTNASYIFWAQNAIYDYIIIMNIHLIPFLDKNMNINMKFSKYEDKYYNTRLPLKTKPGPCCISHISSSEYFIPEKCIFKNIFPVYRHIMSQISIFS
jgi:hypothetical protein